MTKSLQISAPKRDTFTISDLIHDDEDSRSSAKDEGYKRSTAQPSSTTAINNQFNISIKAIIKYGDAAGKVNIASTIANKINEGRQREPLMRPNIGLVKGGQ